jgi:Na+-transporting NADH:ubiquinone oxidoreductase subunit C
LSITSGSLRSFQEDNVRLDTKKQILNSLPGIELGEDAAATYAATIKEYNMLDAEGNVVKSLDPVADFDIKAEEGQFPMYVAEVNGETKYILPMNGAGLWGAIWGYMALNDDRNTVFGVFFNHAGETPGLGAEIVTEKFRNPFIGKELLKNGKFASIAIEKAGTKVEGRDQVDAISGGTITSKGVEAMLSSSLVNYENFLTAPAAIVVEEVADSVIVEPVIEE